jgi:hypothetical protein
LSPLHKMFQSATCSEALGRLWAGFNLPENPEQCNVHGMKTAWTLTLLLLACPMCAQDASGAAKVYKDQFLQLRKNYVDSA